MKEETKCEEKEFFQKFNINKDDFLFLKAYRNISPSYFHQTISKGIGNIPQIQLGIIRDPNIEFFKCFWKWNDDFSFTSSRKNSPLQDYPLFIDYSNIIVQKRKKRILNTLFEFFPNVLAFLILSYLVLSKKLQIVVFTCFLNIGSMWITKMNKKKSRIILDYERGTVGATGEVGTCNFGQVDPPKTFPNPKKKLKFKRVFFNYMQIIKTKQNY